MFSFHKPRVYRSTEGCCICRAKSSSSRFTDSRKYEEDSMKCFDLKSPRYGEICNACVLLVKRYKRLPAGSQRHWGHVVDARAGPGTKISTKIKRNKEEFISANNSNNSEIHVPNNKSAISEKFSKIFKKSKNKKLKNNPIEESIKKSSYISPVKIPNKMTLYKRNDSVESDNGDSRESSPLSGANSPKSDVQFQTQTRSSLNRTKNNSKSLHLQRTGVKKSIHKVKYVSKISGSKRRKKFTPQKNRLSIDSNVKFFDDEEWSKRTICCGVIYECTKLPGATIIDLDNFKPCNDHQQRNGISSQYKTRPKHVTDITQKSIKATLPAVVKLSLPLTGSSANINPTPVLKKHHLFYKRQSEMFPNGDMITPTPNESTTKSKTETNSQATINFITESMNTSKLQITAISNQPHNSNAKGSIIEKAISSSEASSSTTAKSSSLLHRIKSDAGKIVKHSIEKLNSAVRLKAHDVAELKNLVKTVDKSVVISKTTAQNILLKVPDLSPTSSSSTKFSDNSSDSGFDENVQDRKSVSPLQHESDAKVPSKPPVQTLILASGVRVHGQHQNLVYAGNEAAAKILQNRLHHQSTSTHRSSNNGTILQHNQRLNVQPITIDPSTAMKLVQTNSSNNVVTMAPYNLAGVKMRPLYNTTTNAIQHENGITTIVPASSIDVATKQNEKLLQAVGASNSVTITPTSNVNNQNHININQKFILLKSNANTNFGHNYKGANLRSAPTE